MAYTLAQLTTFFTNANATTAPTAAQTTGLQGIANQNATGVLTDAQALQAAIDMASDVTTAVSVQTYQFFLGFAPSVAGLAALNAAFVGSGAQAGLNGENRFIAQSVALALQNPTAKASFTSNYGSLSIVDATKAAYNVIVGNTAAAAAGINVDSAVAFLTSEASVAYYTAFVKANVPGLAEADVTLAVKAALIGEIIYQATIFNNGAGVGSYATAANNLIKDLADDGALTANNANGIDLFANYGVSPAAKTYTLTVAADTVAGGAGDDTINALSVDANGVDATTVTQFDAIDGGQGVDTLNIYTTATKNTGLPANASVKNVEIVNVYNTAAAGAFGDASLFTGVTQLNQIGAAAAAVTNLAATTTAGFSGTTGGASVATAAGAATAKVALTNFAEGTTLAIGADAAASALNSVTVTGSVQDSNANGSVAAINLNLISGKNVTSMSVATAAKATLTVTNNTNNTGGAVVTTVDASASTGAVTYVAANNVTTVTTGSGADNVTLQTATVIDNPGTAADETVSGTLTTGAGGDTIVVNTSGTGKATISAGDGADGITINSRGTGAVGNTLTIDGGAGDDTVTMTATSSIAYAASATAGVRDSVSGGDGTDTLAFSAAIGTAVSGDTNFNKAISGFEKVSVGLVGNAENATINLANLDDISYVVSSGSSFAAGVTETHAVTFNALLPGQSVTVGGATYTNNTGATLTAAQVATNFAAAYDLSGYTEALAGTQITYTAATANTNTTDITASAGNASAPSAPSITVNNGVAPVAGTTESAVVTFQGLIAGESVTVANRVVTATAITETAVVTFTDLVNGQVLTINGVTVTVGAGGATAAQIAQAFATGATVGDAVVTGANSGFYTVTNTGNVATFTSTTASANVANLTVAGNANGTVTLTVTDGNNGNLTAAQVASAFGAGATQGAAVVSGALAGWTAAAASGNQVTVTSTTANAPVANVGVSTTAGTAPTVVTTDGVAPVVGVTENGTVTFGALTDGQSVTVEGRTVTATGGNLTAAQVADAFASNTSAGAAIVTGTLTAGWTINNAAAGDAVIEYVSGTANTNVPNFAASAGNAPTAPTAPAIASVQGATAFGSLNVNNLGANGTLELRGVTAGTTTVALKDATGTADVVNIMINGTSNIVNTGSVVVAGVETINITTADRTSTADPTTASTINLSAAAATTLTVTGNHGVNFTGSTLGNLVSLDASGVVSTLSSATAAAAAAAVTFTSTVTGSSKSVSVTTGMGDDVIALASGNTKGGSITSGAGNDMLTGSGGVDTISAGVGNDVVNSSAGADVVSLGSGNDSFKLLNSTHSVLATAQTISDFTANTVAQSTASKGADANVLVRTGDVIDVSSVLGGGVTGIKVAVAANAADAQTVIQNISTNDGTLTGFVLDSSTGKLYLDFNDDGNIDSVITLTGVSTLDTAAFLTGL